MLAPEMSVRATLDIALHCEDVQSLRETLVLRLEKRQDLDPERILGIDR